MSALLMMLVACGGPSEQSLVNELRVMAVVAEPPELGPGEQVELQVHLLDPLERGAELMVWSCTPGADGCLEDELELTPRVAVLEPEDGVAQLQWTAPMELVGVLQQVPELPVFLNLLACEPGLCDVIADEGQGQDLSNPLELAEQLPLEGTSLATGTLWVSAQPPEGRRDNPVVELEPLPDVVQVGDTLELSLLVEPEGAADAWGYATAGGFLEPSVSVGPEAVQMSWLAPEDPGQVELVVVVQQDGGGTSVVRRWVTVE